MLPFVFLFLFFLSPPSLTLSLNQDGLFLLRAKQQLSDPDNSLATWNGADATPCRWRGVTCDPLTGAVTAVNLSFSDLSGPFPGVLCRLPSLSSLSLSDNLISSTLPAASVAAFRRLRHLDLSQNALFGPIPHTLSQIPSLQRLDLSFNNFSGEIPASLGQLRRLESLILVYNFLNGTLPNSLGNITTLKELQLAYNPFSPSPIPSELGNLTNLEDLWLADCNLVGHIPSSLGNLARLTNLDLSQNRLTGNIPESFAGLTSVTQIELFNNTLSGELPDGLSNLTRLERFDASMNELTGTIPPGLCELPLASLNLFENRLEGSLPESIARSPNLYELKLFHNRLVGELPSDLGSNSPLQHIDVSYNRFSGEIPANLCGRGQFEELIMIYNSFSGEIPESLGNCKSLTRVRLRNNKLSGVVPDAFWGLPRLYLLELIDNSLSGHISNAISGAYNLSILLLSNNRFSGSIPDGIGLLHGLLEFSASRNNLSGRIPPSMLQLSQLSSLDLSDNKLAGELLGGISHWTKLTGLYLANNRFDGHIPSELGSLHVLNNLDLSGNYFSGEIPDQLQNLKLYKLNLSYNNLSGDIPPLFTNDKYRMSFVGNPGLCGHLSGLCSGSGESRNRRFVWIFRSIFVLAGVVFIFGVAWFYFKYRNVKRLKKGFNISKWRSFHKLGFSEFEVVKLLSEDNVIGSGASGKVYKVVLSNGEVVAVKKLWGASKKVNESVSSQKDEFDVEVETLGRIRHKNIVRLWCCCNSGDNKLLVYEYMPNGSLADMLENSKKSLLDWPTRYKIAIDAAEGLSYLHHDCVPPIVHRDVKSSNILLDGEFVAKVADFGVAKIVTGVSQGAESMSVIAGSYGYIAPVSIATAANVTAQVNGIPMLNGTNFKVWKEAVEIVLGCMELDVALRLNRPTHAADNSNEAKVEKWDRSNRMCLMIMKRSIPEAFRGSISESEDAKKFLQDIEQYYAKNEKAEASSLLAKLISMRYKGKGNIREYILEMSNLASKLKALKLELSDDLLVHLVLISLPAHFGQFKVSYNTQKDKWSLNELISYCVQEEERQHRDKTESAHLVTNSQNKKRKRAKDTAESSSQQKKKQKKQDEEFTCYFCKKAGHMKKDCPKYANWRVKKGLPVEPSAK